MKKINHKLIALFLVLVTFAIDMYFITIYGNVWNKQTAFSSFWLIASITYLAIISNEEKKV